MLQKKLLVSAIAGAAALGLSSIAFANGGGYGAAPVAAAAPADSGAGFVVGVQGGYADTHWDNVLNEAKAFGFGVKDNGFSARGFVGYDFNHYLGVEAGYIYLPTAKISGGGSDAKLKNYAIDLFGKLSVPVADGFGLYAKAGGAYLHTKSSGSATSSGVTLVGTGNSTSHIGPAYGVGAYYEIMPNLKADLSWTRYSGNNNVFTSSGTEATNYQPNPDVFLLGLSYKFPVNF